MKISQILLSTEIILGIFYIKHKFESKYYEALTIIIAWIIVIILCYL